MREKLLIVDDEQNVLTFCTRALQRHGYEVQSALSGEAALELLQSERFDLLATDIKMPGMSGIELMRHALKLRADLAIIVITGMGTFDVSVEALRAGAHDFLAKPFGADQLIQAVGYALEQAHLIRERARLRLLEPLLELSQRTLYQMDLESLGQSILQIALAQTQAVGAALLLEEPEQTFAIGLPAASLQAYGRAVDRSDRTQVRAWTLEELGAEAPAENGQSSALGALVYAPLDASTGAVGALVIALARAALQVDRSELDMISVLAGQAAALLENARLMQRLEDWNRTLEQRVLQRTRELEMAQERLLRAERLATVGQFGSSIAHELRNPLGVISNSVYYIKMRLDGADEKLEKHLDIITREVQTSNRIITDLMNFVRVGQLKRQATAPSALVLEVLERAHIPNNVHLTTDVPEDLPLVCVDPDKLHQVLLNLIDNAVQAMPHGGTLAIRGYEEHGALCLVVADSGEGIPQENMERIFEPLFTTKARGIGLGLAIVRMMVEAHGGQIDVASELGQGADFTVCLPIEVQVAAEELCA
jgi:signal transduction histidine kinase